MRQDDPAATAQRQLDAYNARDIEGFLAAYADGVVIRAHPSGTVIMRGIDELRERYGLLFADHRELHCRLLHRIVHECFAIDHEEVSGLRKETVYAVATYEVRDGLIRNAWFLKAP